MTQEYEPVIGLEVHAELKTRSKMFCGCPVVDSTLSSPNTAVCPVCAGMPGVLPVVNQQAVELALRVALALDCHVEHTSLFARKNYFYPDLPKGYQISQYEHPLAQHGRLSIDTVNGEEVVRIRRVHLEEDTGKLTHVAEDAERYSLVDLNRAGVPLLEIVTEPDMHSIEAVRAYATALRSILRVLDVNSGDMEKGVIRFEANVSVRPVGSQTLGTRVEIKNLNSFRALERAVAYQIEQQIERLRRGEQIDQETVGWDETKEITFSQRSKEEAHDYRYFPEPDLPPLVVEREWIEHVRANLPELPRARQQRFVSQYQLSALDAGRLAEEKSIADYFEACIAAAADIAPRLIANWITDQLFGWMNQTGEDIEQIRVSPQMLAGLLQRYVQGNINQNTAKMVLEEMLRSGETAETIIGKHGLEQISDSDIVAELVGQVLRENPQELENYLAGKATLSNWFFGQVMRLAAGKANPQVVRQELEKQLRMAGDKLQ
ncbi:MAG: Asp-tRNA(Asn)/Glu-tRNA(Gln) amidotransferase subunit GatB [Anaerolineae bacterium]|nr:Asp-tRNA(Asn)/Glu-tRNA(Gln) amidotransferase subunit GatB [Anaerolineae bacterium]